MIKTISVSPELAELARIKGLSWTEASRIGMSQILSAEGVNLYMNELNKKRRKELLEAQIRSLKGELDETNPK